MDEVLKKKRVKDWLNQCLKMSGSSDIRELPDKTYGFKDLKEWEKYRDGNKGKLVTPTEETVVGVDRDIPGTAEIFLKGAYGVPVWSILECDEQTCLDYVDEFIDKQKRPQAWMMKYRKPVKQMTLMEKCQSVLEVSVPDECFRKPSNVNVDDLPDYWWADEDNPPKVIDLRFGDTSKYFYSITEVMAKQGNIITSTLAKSKLRQIPQFLLKDNLKDKFLDDYKIAKPENILVIFALVVLFVEQSRISEKDSLTDLNTAYYLISGIDKAFKELFGEELYVYISRKREEWDITD